MCKYFLGIDTSNYTTSVALIDENGNILSDKRKLLEVKKGSRGLRQSDAFFQHINNLPKLLTEAVANIDKRDIKAVAVSDRPRNVEGSYMPVFLAGIRFAETICGFLDIPIYRFSHQEGHIKAIEFSNHISDEFICFHLSGGTTEILKTVKESGSLTSEIIGETLDISFGQLIDRVGVALEEQFPAGEAMDALALRKVDSDMKLTPIKISGLNINLSGIETQILKCKFANSKEEIAYKLFDEIAKCLEKLVDRCKEIYPGIDVIFAGGVSQSGFLQERLKSKVIFGKYGSDNALGIALLGGLKHGDKTN